MKLSVIIVSYNVKDFLRHCLDAVERAIAYAQLSAEVIVVDNQSTDGTAEELADSYEKLNFILNPENRGFAKACNQGAALATGEFILFLNPDTLIPPDSLKDCISFIASRPDAGAIGVRMVDENGNFLKESKRSFPSPVVSFYKLFGMAALFPRSRIFARYYLGHLSENEDHPVEILSGAFMLIRKTVFEKTGGFDERFFMYAEDIDLSYRITKDGYRNYYFSGCTITHFKGKSTAKDIRYVKMFYRAMVVFAVKYYGSHNPYTYFLKAGIWTRAVLSATRIFFRNIFSSR